MNAITQIEAVYNGLYDMMKLYEAMDGNNNYATDMMNAMALNGGFIGMNKPISNDGGNIG